MCEDNITPEVIAAIKAAGFDVYMREEPDTYLFYTDGVNIGYIQSNHLSGGWDISSVHKSSPLHGTSYGVLQSIPVENLTRDVLLSGFIDAPSWAHERSTVKKYRNWEEFSDKRSPWQSEFKKV